MMSLGAALSCLSGGLISNYNEVLEEAPFSPLDLSPVLWFDASDASTITESAGAVSQWDDKSGNALHATQGTGSSQPTTGVTTLNGLNVLDFANDKLLLPDLSAYFNGSQNRTVISVVVTDSSTYNTIINIGNSAYTGSRFTFQGHNGNLSIALQGAFFNSTLVSTSWGIAAANFDGTQLKDVDLYFGGGTPQASTSTTALNTDASVSNIIGDTNSIGEILAFDRALSASEMNQIGQYIADKWALTWTEL